MTISEAGRKYPEDIEVKSALERMCGNEALYVKFLRRFLEDTHYQEFCRAFKQGDREEAMHSAHALKGLAGNLGLMALFEQSARVVDQLRREERDIDTDGFHEAYRKAASIIEQLS